mmetsp:Transcript_16776/g.37105  ORF Transcript_16776/g.37105 Transcript_16776/m.37105 type:complete len:267 (+) Transcript_16776:30-830(+)
MGVTVDVDPVIDELEKKGCEILTELVKGETAEAAPAGDLNSMITDLQKMGDQSQVASDTPPDKLLAQLKDLELSGEVWYLYAPHFDMRNVGDSLATQGTWVKKTCAFSWEVPEQHKIHIPEGLRVPSEGLPYAVDDPDEVNRHDWVCQHRKIWLTPRVVQFLKQRATQWYIYWPHWRVIAGPGNEVAGLVALANTWVKRTAQFSEKLGKDEKSFVGEGQVVYISGGVKMVEAPLERRRHQYIDEHRCIVLSSRMQLVQGKDSLFMQ